MVEEKKMIKAEQIWDMAQKLGITFDRSYENIVKRFMELDKREAEAMKTKQEAGPS